MERISREINGQTEFNMQFWVAKENHTVLGIIGLADPIPKVLPLAKTQKPGELKILYVDNERILVQFIEPEAAKQGYQELLIRSTERYKDTAYVFYKKWAIVKRNGNWWRCN